MPESEPNPPESADPVEHAPERSQEVIDLAVHYVNGALYEGKQPRAYIARRLHDGFQGVRFTQREIADLLGVSVGTVNRDLANTVAPKSWTDRGAPVYPKDRFDKDPDFKARVAELTKDVPEAVARKLAAAEFAGPIIRPITEFHVSDEQTRLREEIVKAVAAASERTARAK